MIIELKHAIEACPFCGSKDVKVHPPCGMFEAFAQCNNCCVTNKLTGAVGVRVELAVRPVFDSEQRKFVWDT